MSTAKRQGNETLVRAVRDERNLERARVDEAVLQATYEQVTASDVDFETQQEEPKTRVDVLHRSSPTQVQLFFQLRITARCSPSTSVESTYVLVR